jgi:hypothetical protein
MIGRLVERPRLEPDAGELSLIGNTSTLSGEFGGPIQAQPIENRGDPGRISCGKCGKSVQENSAQGGKR